MRVVYWALFALTALTGCNITGDSQKSEGEPIAMNYATLLHLYDCGSYVTAEITNPWDTTKLLHRYVLVPSNAEMPGNLPKATVVRTPVTHAVMFSGIHCALICEMGKGKSITGALDVQFISIPQILAGLRDGTITDLGDSKSPNIEKLADIKSDALLVSPFENSGGYGAVEKLKVPIIECADYMETSALGRAEWIKFYGMLFGCENEAKELFSSIEQNYNSLKAQVANVESKPSVLVDMRMSNTWYVPGGESTIAHMISDAGGNYIFADTEQSGSIPLSFESVYEKGENADIWIIKYYHPQDYTYTTLKDEFTPYSSIKAFKEKKIWGCNTAYSNYFEEVTYHPELALRNFIAIFHPEVLSDGDKYYKPFAD